MGGGRRETIFVREDGYSPGLAFDNMQSRQLKGTTPCTEYSIKLPIDPEANRIFFGVLLAGTEKTWADDLQLLVDGKPVWDALTRRVASSVGEVALIDLQRTDF